jgi:hypothetical protein
MRSISSPTEVGSGLHGSLRRRGCFARFRAQWNQSLGKPISQTGTLGGCPERFAKPSSTHKESIFLLLEGIAAMDLAVSTREKGSLCEVAASAR